MTTETHHILTIKKELKEPIETTDIRKTLTDEMIQFNPELKDDQLIDLLPRKIKEYKLALRSPEFKEYIGAMNALSQPSGQRNLALGGKFILDTCSLEGYEEIKKDAGLLYSACLEAFGLLEFYDTELKKK